MSDPIQAATSLVKKLNAPAQAHSVYIQTNVGPNGQFEKVLCVSIRPEWKSKIQVPAKHMGYPIHEVEWPKEPE